MPITQNIFPFKFHHLRKLWQSPCRVKDHLHGLPRASGKLVFETRMRGFRSYIRGLEKEATFAKSRDVQGLSVHLRQRCSKDRENSERYTQLRPWSYLTIQGRERLNAGVRTVRGASVTTVLVLRRVRR